MDIQLPVFLKGKLIHEEYVNWLKRKAVSLRRRDKRRYKKLGKDKPLASLSRYRNKIHEAVISSEGRDYYTNEELSWNKIGNYNNEESKKKGRQYRREFYDLPTIDHYDSENELDFRICSWIVNDCKSDLSYDDFLQLCEKVLRNRKV